MKKISLYSLQFILILTILFIANGTANVYEKKVENNNENKSINLSTMALKVIENNEIKKFSAKDTFTGDMTGYAYNCPLCTGLLACKWDYNIKDGTTTYLDSEYGEVLIVASSKNLPCGSIIRFYNNRVSPKESLAIVLDRGVLGNDLDLLVESEQYAYDNIGRLVITYDVLRFGWEQQE
ncbi:MAG: hypothetical protein E7172_00870 [Firmicutes bacterium]|nr:hypothetical protein [Bacillota bacterium]